MCMITLTNNYWIKIRGCRWLESLYRLFSDEMKVESFIINSKVDDSLIKEI